MSRGRAINAIGTRDLALNLSLFGPDCLKLFILATTVPHRGVARKLTEPASFVIKDLIANAVVFKNGFIASCTVNRALKKPVHGAGIRLTNRTLVETLSPVVEASVSQCPSPLLPISSQLSFSDTL